MSQLKLEFVKQMSLLAPVDGEHGGLVPNIFAYRVSQPREPKPVIYRSGIIIIAQGMKRGFVDGMTYEYSADNYLVVATTLPFHSQIIEATAEKPLLSLVINVEPVEVAALADEIDAVKSMPRDHRDEIRTVYATPIEEPLLQAAVRLARVLKDPLEARILGPQLKREILFRVMMGPQAGSLRALARRESDTYRIGMLVREIESNPGLSITVGEMAARVGMSESAFYTKFKSMTYMSPIQYQKTVRLHRAHQMITQQNMRVTDAAFHVGYSSSSQFSREYKRFFGAPPSQAEQVRTADREPQRVIRSR